MRYEYGQIILVPVADGHGNVKPHPAVILSPSDEIVPGARLRVVCVSSQVEDPCPPHPAPLAAATSPTDRPEQAQRGQVQLAGPDPSR
jgi:hypothetical protein